MYPAAGLLLGFGCVAHLCCGREGGIKTLSKSGLVSYTIKAIFSSKQIPPNSVSKLIFVNYDSKNQTLEFVILIKC